MSLLPVFWLALFLLACCIFANFWVWTAIMTRKTYSGTRQVICPETRRRESVEFDGWEAARSRLASRLHLRLQSCSRWPVRRDCDQACRAQVVRHQEELVALQPPHASRAA